MRLGQGRVRFWLFFRIKRREIKEAGCGVCVPIGEARALADAVIWSIEHKSEVSIMGRRSRNRFEDWFEKSKLMDAIDEHIQKSV